MTVIESKSDHAKIKKVTNKTAALDIQTYFADPYCSWQRGSNEKYNGLLRQYIPMGVAWKPSRMRSWLCLKTD